MMSPLGIGAVLWEVSVGYQVAEEKDEHAWCTPVSMWPQAFHLGSEPERELHGLLYLQHLGEFLLLTTIYRVNNNK